MKLCENMAWEYRTLKQLRDRETDVNGYLKQRHKELTDPQLDVALFDTERNDAAKKGWREQVNMLLILRGPLQFTAVR